MEIEELTLSDASDAATLWRNVDLTRPWNDSHADFTRALEGATSSVLGAREGGQLIGTVMVGHDGHRGWVYYLAVAPSHQRLGVGTRLLAAAEHWLGERGAVKVQLMVRDTNSDIVSFYERLGYDDANVTVMARWLKGPSA